MHKTARLIPLASKGISVQIHARLITPAQPIRHFGFSFSIMNQTTLVKIFAEATLEGLGRQTFPEKFSAGPVPCRGMVPLMPIEGRNLPGF